MQHQSIVERGNRVMERARRWKMKGSHPKVAHLCSFVHINLSYYWSRRTITLMLNTSGTPFSEHYDTCLSKDMILEKSSKNHAVFCFGLSSNAENRLGRVLETSGWVVSFAMFDAMTVCGYKPVFVGWNWNSNLLWMTRKMSINFMTDQWNLIVTKITQ